MANRKLSNNIFLNSFLLKPLGYPIILKGNCVFVSLQHYTVWWKKNHLCYKWDKMRLEKEKKTTLQPNSRFPALTVQNKLSPRYSSTEQLLWFRSNIYRESGRGGQCPRKEAIGSSGRGRFIRKASISSSVGAFTSSRLLYGLFLSSSCIMVSTCFTRLSSASRAWDTYRGQRSVTGMT